MGKFRVQGAHPDELRTEARAFASASAERVGNTSGVTVPPDAATLRDRAGIAASAASNSASGASRRAVNTPPTMPGRNPAARQKPALPPGSALTCSFSRNVQSSARYPVARANSAR